MTTHSSANSSISLWTLPADGRCTITGYDDALPDSYRIRLMELGFHLGETVVCLQAPGFGAPRVYRVSNTIFSLDDDVASHIRIEPVPADA